jgi:protein phosphatase
VGTTVVAAVVHEGALFWRSVGDSRLYLWRKPCFSQVTTDHDYGRWLDLEAAKGLISHEQAQRNPNRQALTSFVGQGPMEAVDANRRPLALQAGDQLLLCSDGLYNSLDNAVMARILEHSLDPHLAAENLVEQAIAQHLSNQDNITALVMGYDDGAVTVRRKTGARKPTVRQRLRRIWQQHTRKPV